MSFSSIIRISVATLMVGVMLPAMLFSRPIFAVARGYTTSDSGLQTGMAAALSSSTGSDSVERASQANNSLVIGVVISPEDSLLTIISGNTKVLVESEGQVDAYVSDINGGIEKGDQLVVSPLRGILMKSSDNASGNIIATAVEKSNGGENYSYQVGDQAQETRIAKIRVNLERRTATYNTVNDSTLSRLGQQITGRSVGEIRLVLAMFIFLVVLIAEAGVLYGAISGALTAIGRNPLAKKTIRRELIRVIGLAIVILGVGLGAMYVMIWI